MNYTEKFGLHPSSSHPEHFDFVAGGGGADTVTFPNAHLLFSGDYSRSGLDLIVSDFLHRLTVPNYFSGHKHPTLVSPEGAALDASVVDALTGHAQYAQAGGSPAAGKLIGHVVKMTGSASLVRNGVTVVLNNGDPVYQTDVVQTGSGSTLGLVMIDGTAFNLNANARLMLNDLTYDVASTSNTSLYTLFQGAASFVAGQVAKTGDMKVGTPIATMGIRGTAVILDISSVDGRVSISVLDQRDGQVHSVQVFNPQGNLIGTVTSNGSTLTLTPVSTFEIIAQQSNKTTAQIAIEFDAFQQVLNTYDVGRQLVPSTPPPTDGRRGDANPNKPTMFGGSTIAPIDSTFAQFNVPVGATATGQQAGSGAPAFVTVTIQADTPRPFSSLLPLPDPGIGVLAKPPSSGTTPVQQVSTPTTEPTGPTVSVTPTTPEVVVTVVVPVVVPDSTGPTSPTVEVPQVVPVPVTPTDTASQEPPVAAPVSLAQGHEDQPITITQAALLAGVIDVHTPLSIIQLSIESGGGTLHRNEDSTWTYTPPANFNGTVIFNYTASDGTQSASSTASLSIEGVNDAPAVTGGTTVPNGHLAVTEDTALTITTLAITDPDAGSAVKVTLSVHHGMLAFNSTTELTGDLNGQDGTVSVTGTLAAINAALASGLVYTPESNYGGPSDLTVTVNDLGNSGSGGAQTTTRRIDIDVASVNDDPHLATGAVTAGTIEVPDGDHETNTLSPELRGQLLAPGLIKLHPNSFGTVALAPNDDESSGPINFVSVFGPDGLNFFGANYQSLFINNNGNVTFGHRTGEFTPSHINAGAGIPIIAPFWADVDTRGPGGGTVYYDLDPIQGVMTITWDHVGYFPSATNRLNSFQLVLINEGNGNFDIDYRYADIQWTTGGASGGINGLGGTPARAGYSAGDGVHAFELPQSGDVSALLALETTPGNTGIAGINEFEVRNGQVGLTTTGTINFSDPDLGDIHTIQSTPVGTTLGSLSFNKTADTTGSGTGGQFIWTYTADSQVVRSALDGIATHRKIESFEVVISDGHGGTLTQTVSVTLNGSGSPDATFSGDVTGSVAEDDPIPNVASGTVTVHDTDAGQGHFEAVDESALVAEFGDFEFDESTGHWTYTLDQSRANSLAANDVEHDILTVVSADGTEQDIVITITGRNDAPTIDAVTLNIAEDTEDSGMLVADLFSAGRFHDVDAGSSLRGIAIVSNEAAPEQGVWQYRVGEEAAWENVGAPSQAEALALSSTTELRFLPGQEFNGAPSNLEVRALDDTYTDAFTVEGTPVTIDTTEHGGSTAISAESATISAVMAPEVEVLPEVEEPETYNGGPDNDLLVGTPASETFYGEAGDDVLTGGGGDDNFVFAADSGRDTITDFTPGDTIDLLDHHPFDSNSAESFEAWITDSDSVEQQSDNTLIHLDTDSSILLLDVVSTTLQLNDFILHP